jgi:two-component system phosphate regulon sensor histidine kinase PhoR
MPRSQLKLVAAISALVAAVVIGFGWASVRDLSERAEARARADLEARLAGARDLLGPLPLSDTPPDVLARRARELSEALDGRVTLVRRDGVVVADSALPRARVLEMENHAGRPEIEAAGRGELGHSIRTSASVGRPLRYVALPVEAGDGTVRLAEPVEEAPELAALRVRTAQALLLGVIGAALVALGISRSQARAIERMRHVASSVASGDFTARLRRNTGDELDPIARAIDQMAEQLRLRLEEATHEKERLRAVLNGMVEGVLVVDTGGKIVLLNQRAREFFGIRGPVESRSFLEAMRHAELDALLSRAAETDEAVSGEIRLAGPGERVLRVQAVRFPSSGARMGTVAVLHDVSEIERLEQVRRDFVANASHELRTPLTAITGFTETLLSSESLGDEDRRAYLEVIDRHAQRLTHLVGDLLELSKIESRKVPLEIDAIDVVGVAERLLEDYHERIAEKDLLASVEHRGAALVRADPRALEQILVNLVDNAIKYTEAGGAVTVRVEASDDVVAIHVEDTGIGIPAEDRERIFERFYRVDKARSRELGGTGLGLAIVKHLVQGQGGEIALVETVLGEGSVFRFTLPRAEGSEG